MAASCHQPELWHEHEARPPPAIRPQVSGGWSRKDSSGEKRDPGDAAEDVQPVRAQRPEADEDPGDALAETGHHGHREQENQREADRLRQRLRLPDAPETGLARYRSAGRPGTRGRTPRAPAEPVVSSAGSPGGTCVQEPDPDPEEAGQEHKVGCLGHVDVIRRDPADQGQLHEQHQEAGEDQPRLVPVLHLGPAAVLGPACAIGPGYIRAGHVRQLPRYPSLNRTAPAPARGRIRAIGPGAGIGAGISPVQTTRSRSRPPARRCR